MHCENLKLIHMISYIHIQHLMLTEILSL